MKEEIIGNARLILGDCREVLPTLGKVDAVITDPPYGIGLNYGGEYEDSQSNLAELAKSWLPIARDMADRVCFTPGVLNQWIYPQPSWVLSWFSPNSSSTGKWGFACWQPILVYGSDPFKGKGRRPDSFEYSVLEKRIEGHPCPKPIRLMIKIIDRTSNLGDLIVDPFMGSGTTGVACIETGRYFIGIEREPKYFDIACRRIEDAQRQASLLGSYEFTDAKSEQLGFEL